MLDKLKNFALKYELLKGEPKKKRVAIPVRQLGLATGQFVYVRRSK